MRLRSRAMGISLLLILLRARAGREGEEPLPRATNLARRAVARRRAAIKLVGGYWGILLRTKYNSPALVVR
jgi:hypothetical protein